MKAVSFVSCFTPAEAVEREARKRGWRPDGGTSFWDHGEPDEHEVLTPHPTFAEALAHARSMLAEDVFGSTRVYRLETDGKRPNVPRTTHMWEVDAASAVSEAEPTTTYDED